MEKKKSLKFNVLMNALLTMSSFIFPLITFPYVSRILLPEGTGKVNFATSFISYFTMIAQLGIPTYGIRACAVVRDDRRQLSKTAQELFIINLVMSALSYVVLFILLLTVPALKDDRTLYIIVSATILLTSIGMEWLYKALEQYAYITIRSLIFKVVAMIAMFGLIHKKEDYVIYGAISIFASCASNVLNLINVHKYIDLKPVGDYDFKRHLKAVSVFFAMTCAATIYTHIDTVMLKFMISNEEVGYYAAATKIKSILVSIITSLGAVLLPRVSYYIKNNMTDEFKKITKKSLHFVLLISCPLMVYFVMYAKEGVLFLSGKEYLNSVIPMQLIMPTIIMIGLTNILGIQILVPLGRENCVLISTVVGAIVDIIINFILIPTMASSGAAIGTLVAEMTVLIVQYYYLKNQVTDAFKSIKYYKIIVSLLAAVAASFWVVKLNLSTFFVLAISAIIYFTVYVICLCLLQEPLIVDMIVQVKNKIIKR
ncbi:MAG: flippase [Ruminococcus sp.]|nr:flippase [Ruminococcus sp.]